MIAEFDARLAALQTQLPPGEKPVFADIGVNNFMSGRDTLFAHVVNAGGWRTLGEIAAWPEYDDSRRLEVLAAAQERAAS